MLECTIDLILPLQLADYTVKMYPIIIQLVAELPAIMLVLDFGTDLCTLVGMRRYQMIIASLVVLLSIFTQSSKYFMQR